jgi:hypothetical protein
VKAKTGRGLQMDHIINWVIFGHELGAGTHPDQVPGRHVPQEARPWVRDCLEPYIWELLRATDLKTVVAMDGDSEIWWLEARGQRPSSAPQPPPLSPATARILSPGQMERTLRQTGASDAGSPMQISSESASPYASSDPMESSPPTGFKRDMLYGTKRKLSYSSPSPPTSCIQLSEDEDC